MGDYISDEYIPLDKFLNQNKVDGIFPMSRAKIEPFMKKTNVFFDKIGVFKKHSWRGDYIDPEKFFRALEIHKKKTLIKKMIVIPEGYISVMDFIENNIFKSTYPNRFKEVLSLCIQYKKYDLKGFLKVGGYHGRVCVNEIDFWNNFPTLEKIRAENIIREQKRCRNMNNTFALFLSAQPEIA